MVGWVDSDWESYDKGTFRCSVRLLLKSYFSVVSFHKRFMIHTCLLSIASYIFSMMPLQVQYSQIALYSQSHHTFPRLVVSFCSKLLPKRSVEHPKS